MKYTAWALVALASLALVAPAQAAMTVQDVIALHESGVGDSVILTQFEAEEAVFVLTVDEIIALREAGVSDTVITYMINTGKAVEAEAEASTPLGETLQQAAEGPEEVVETESSGGGGGNLSVGLAVGTGGFGVSLGYYYPSWPGYYYGYYYDPFYWTGWGGYYAWCAPYPYWRWYNSWYACYPYSANYWYGCATPYPYYGSHHGGYHDGYYANRTDDGRYVGSRGTPRRGRVDYGNGSGSDGGRGGVTSRGSVAYSGDLDSRYRMRDPVGDVAVREMTSPDRSVTYRPRDPNVSAGRSTVPTVRTTPSRQPTTPRVGVSRTPTVQRPVQPTVRTQPSRQNAQPSRQAPAVKKAPEVQKQPTPPSRQQVQPPSRSAPQQRVQPAPARSAPSRSAPASRGSSSRGSSSRGSRGG